MSRRRRRNKGESFIRSLTVLLVPIAVAAGVFGELPEEPRKAPSSEISAVSSEEETIDFADSSGERSEASAGSSKEGTADFADSSGERSEASAGSFKEETESSAGSSADRAGTDRFDISQIPAWSGKPSVDVNGDVPYFTDEELKAEPFESYSDLDELGRCGAAYACVGPETMPAEKRGRIGKIRPTGWHTVKYAGIDGNYLYNRCHLIGYQLTGENANEKNLITGTRYMNVQGMLEFENSVAMYVRTTGYHVLYRVTPVFEGDNLLASGVLMEAESVEDQQIRYCAFCYNVQPGITIDYATGDSSGPEYTGN